MATPTVECAECCGEGHDLDTLYWGDEYCEEGTEVDCSACGGDGTVPAQEYEVQVVVIEYHVVTVVATDEAHAGELAHEEYLDPDSAYAQDKKIVHIGKKEVDSTAD